MVPFNTDVDNDEDKSDQRCLDEDLRKICGHCENRERSRRTPLYLALTLLTLSSQVYRAIIKNRGAIYPLHILFSPSSQSQWEQMDTIASRCVAVVAQGTLWLTLVYLSVGHLFYLSLSLSLSLFSHSSLAVLLSVYAMLMALLTIHFFFCVIQAELIQGLN